MERPSSRGGSSSAFAAGGMSKAPTGSNVPMPDRPSTASRQGPAVPMGGGTLARGPGQSIMSGAPPGTAMRGGGGGAVGAPPGTAYKRTGTAQGQRPGTGSQGGGSVAVRGGQVQVESRPITNHGLTGIKVSGGGGGGRQVLDKTYFMNELRKKRLEIVNVITSMKTELEALEKKQAQYNTMESRCNDLMKEVKLFQEALADYNTVLDKVGSQTPAYAITQEHAVLKDRNDQQRKRVDDILTERLALEHKTKQAENKILEIQQNMDTRLAGMPPSQRQQYYDLLAEQQALQAESKRFEDAIDALDTQLTASEGELARNPLKQKSLQLQDQLRQLTERKYELQQEEERSKMSPEDQREQLMSKIKRDNAEVDTITSQIREAQDAIKKMESRASSLGGAGALSNAAEEAAKREKFEELLAKERDLQNFMDGFPGLKAAKAAEAQAKQDAIVAALERISKLQQIATSSLPSQKKFKEMQDELEYKKLQLENTQMTQERLKEELQLRRTELDKIDTLEDKIKVELAQLAEKMEQLRKNMDQYNNVADVKQRAEASRERLEYLRGTLLRRKDLLKLTVTERALKHQAKKAQLQENNMAITLEKLEQKLRSLHTAKYTMEDFIKAKESETNYKGLAADVIKISEELNGYIKRAIA